jgi:hypothetical protein
VAGYYEHGNEPSVSIKDVEFLDWLSDNYLLKKDWSMMSAFRTYPKRYESSPHHQFPLI